MMTQYFEVWNGHHWLNNEFLPTAKNASTSIAGVLQKLSSSNIAPDKLQLVNSGQRQRWRVKQPVECRHTPGLSRLADSARTDKKQQPMEYNKALHMVPCKKIFF